MRKILINREKIIRTGKQIFIVLGLIFSVLLVTANTSLPFWMLYDLGTSEQNDSLVPPKYLVLMGGSGMPGADNLMRIYYCSGVAKQYPQAEVYIALPGDTLDSCSDVSKIKKEMVLHKVEAKRIHFAINGLNTRSQALELATLIDTASNITVVTSPEHIYRAVESFRKVGFRHIRGIPAFGKPNDTALEFDDDYGGKSFVPNIGEHIGLRYQFWVHLNYEVRVFREYVAIFYYKIKGWI